MFSGLFIISLLFFYCYCLYFSFTYIIIIIVYSFSRKLLLLIFFRLKVKFSIGSLQELVYYLLLFLFFIMAFLLFVSPFLQVKREHPDRYPFELLLIPTSFDLKDRMFNFFTNHPRLKSFSKNFPFLVKKFYIYIIIFFPHSLLVSWSSSSLSKRTILTSS